MLKYLAGLFAAIVMVFGGLAAYQYFLQNYRVDTGNNGSAIPNVIVLHFRGENALKVASASGNVQSVAHVSRLFGWLQPDRVVKGPFTVDYFVSLARLNSRDFVWNSGTGLLKVYVPDVVAGPVNIDESRATIAATRGWFVTREAAEELVRLGSAQARQIAQAKAQEPALMNLARDKARIALARDFRAPMESAGLTVKDIQVRFQGELDPLPKVADQPMERSRSLAEVFGLAR